MKLSLIGWRIMNLEMLNNKILEILCESEEYTRNKHTRICDLLNESVHLLPEEEPAKKFLILFVKETYIDDLLDLAIKLLEYSFELPVDYYITEIEFYFNEGGFTGDELISGSEETAIKFLDYFEQQTTDWDYNEKIEQWLEYNSRLILFALEMMINSSYFNINPKILKQVVKYHKYEGSAYEEWIIERDKRIVELAEELL